LLPSGDVNLINWDKSHIDFEDFRALKMAEGPTISRVELRKSLYQYLQKKLRLIRYTPPGHPENFDNQWHYMSSVLVAKTIKDMIIQSGKIEEEFT
jgi:hypothetical protein